MTKNEIRAIENPKNIKDVVINRVVSMQSSGGLTVPAGYDPTNALHSAWLIFESDKKLMNATDESKATALFKMVTLGLDPSKSQGYFIPYGNAVQFQVGYQGNVMILKRDASALTVDANVIYKGDNFKFEIDPKTGKRFVTKHEQTLESLDNDEPIGVWCQIAFDDERLNHTEIMTYEQVKKAWLQSPMLKTEADIEKSKTHNNFKEEMIKKTVINRASKRFRNTVGVATNESILRELEKKERKMIFDAEIEEKQATEEIDFEAPEEEKEKIDIVEPEFVDTKINEDTGEILDAEYKEYESAQNNTDEEAPF